MHTKNITIVSDFFLLGFPGLGQFKTLVFVLILLAYVVTVLLDIVIIVLLATTESLRSPMYFFLEHFLASEMVFVTVIIPNMLHVIWWDGATIGVTGCFIQSYLVIASGSSECSLLVAMSYDRYLAICKPLHYNTIMDLKHQYFLVSSCWMFGTLLTLNTLGLLLNVMFCGPNVINHYYCDLVPLVDLACSDTTALQICIFVLSVLLIVVPFFLVIVSYVSIFVVILRIPSTTGKKKAFSTCSTHLSVVGMFYGTCMLNYFIPVEENSSFNKIILVLALVVTPLFNPIIYSLRNQDMHAVINRYKMWWK